MGAFDMLFRDNRRPMMMMGRQPKRGMGKIGLIGLAGLGYAAYRFLKSERGREVASTLAGQVRTVGESIRSQATRGNEAQF